MYRTLTLVSSGINSTRLSVASNSIVAASSTCSATSPLHSKPEHNVATECWCAYQSEHALHIENYPNLRILKSKVSLNSDMFVSLTPGTLSISSWRNRLQKYRFNDFTFVVTGTKNVTADTSGI
eukprot:gb/GECG01008887.1/.p1 GENE.gb/GECG01008887.1/~~gb/GECG01008887.1/.p1  ORF type:complete len:124 (+),score=6.32 gb/GECG01008887.1/:1-372(+)